MGEKMKMKNFVKIMSVKESEKANYDNVVHWDLETFQGEDDVCHGAYASGWHDGTLHKHYGKGCLDKTIDEFIKYENKIISAYNGSSFDFYYLLKKLAARNIPVKNMVLNNGRLMSMEFGKGNKIFDLCLFLIITCSLDSACNDYKIINSKAKFDHSLMKSWEDTKKYRDKVEPYLDLDVLALKELFEKFNDLMYEI
jgi:DNA polymerase elongation subunit (family B)